ncbi:MAG: hypothetical protein ABJQ71_05970 [Roseibium sp.]
MRKPSRKPGVRRWAGRWFLSTCITLCFCASVLLCGLLIAGLTTFSEVMPFMLAQIGQLTVVGTVTAAGRTWEKRHGADGSTAADHGGAVS